MQVKNEREIGKYPNNISTCPIERKGKGERRVL
jgi:hypothetical protein